jgi:hypothetical protein
MDPELHRQTLIQSITLEVKKQFKVNTSNKLPILMRFVAIAQILKGVNSEIEKFVYNDIEYYEKNKYK